ncbi:MAG: hypothetical protein ACRC7O_05145, partial [Fimbriiglobus sp.]
MILDPGFAKYLPYLIGGSVTAVVLAFVLLSRGGIRTGRKQGLPSKQSAEWGISNQAFSDRRSTVRRDGPP